MQKTEKSQVDRIAVVGLACRYPDANTPDELFTNSISQRRSFRTIPQQRLSSPYFDETGQHPDKSYIQQAAVLKNFEFDRAKFKIPLSSYLNTDMTHWLALTVAAEAIQDVQFRKKQFKFDNNSVRVVIGNTLAGEFSRANILRLRWPYVRGVVAKQLQKSNLGLSDKTLSDWLQELEHLYKLPFPVPNEDFLSGGLGNTIAGRICNYFDFKGGGYTVDGACSSSLLATTDACNALRNFDADVVLAGGVDLSIDPFELVGFSRTLALAKSEMRVFDKFSQGFWPGEGCGFVVLMRYEDAIQNCSRIYGVINGWGVSSDGRGGLTRPEVDGQKLALKRCYEQAGYGIETVTYFEGHGTGTKVGDATELTALISSREEAQKPINKAVISSIKANIGHTKAAAGIASLIRVLKCLERKVIPPTTGCIDPHMLFSEHQDNLIPAKHAATWETDEIPRRAGVSAMGFGGINTHIAVEEFDRDTALSQPCFKDNPEWEHLENVQDTELFLFSYSSPQDLSWTIDYVAGFAEKCSLAEFTDLAVELAHRSTRGALSRWRAAIVAKTPTELAAKLRQMSQFMETFEGGLHVDKDIGFSIFGGVNTAKIGFLFSGQGSPVRASGGGMERRLQEVRSVFTQPHLAKFHSINNTDYAQVAITMANLAGLKSLQRLGITADLAIGHSLGELSALHWAECVSESDLIKMVFARGAVMASEDAKTSGSMLAIAMDSEQVRGLICDTPNLFIANHNSSQQTIVSGTKKAINELIKQLKKDNISATLLKVKQAFHSPLMQKSAEMFKPTLRDIPFAEAKATLISTVTGHKVDNTTDWQSYLCNQITNPVLFKQTIEANDADIDLFIEVGTGSILTNLVGQISNKPSLAIDVGNESLAPFLSVVGAAFVAGRALKVDKLFNERYFKPFSWGVEARFLSNQCELNDIDYHYDDADAPLTTEHIDELDIADDGNILESLREAIAVQVGLPKWTIQNDSRMLSDLHLNSITVSKIVAEVAHSVGLPAMIDPTQFSNSSITEICMSLENLIEVKGNEGANQQGFIYGVHPWVRYFSTDYQPKQKMEVIQEVDPGTWDVVLMNANQDPDLYESIVSNTPGDGVLLVLDSVSINGYPDLLLETAQHCLKQQSGEMIELAVIQHEAISGGFLKSFSLENPCVKVVLFTILSNLNEKMAVTISGQLGATGCGFTEFRVAETGDLETPLLSHVPKSSGQFDFPVDENDLVLVTGGGKGISAECGYQLALNTGCALLIIGRSDLAVDEELARNIERLNHAKLRATYFRANVMDSAAIESAIDNALANWGMSHIAGIIHGAGVNHPNLVERLSSDNILETMSPKIDGLHNLISHVDPYKLKLLVTFSSIIGQIGMHGEADYALANERLSLETVMFQEKYPHVLCRALEWSIWSGTGMGHSLGRIDALMQQGIAPITIEDGIKEFLHLISCRTYPTSLIVTSRFKKPDMTHMSEAESTHSRFIETVEINYPGIEFIAKCCLHTDIDLYLNDHVLESAKLFPAALVLEVIAEAIDMLSVPGGNKKRLVFKDMKFIKAIVVPDSKEGLTLRVATLVEQDKSISCVIRCSDTNFQINHAEATAVLVAEDAHIPNLATEPYDNEDLLPDFDVNKTLYTNILFQQGRFKRVGGYRHIEASGCSAQLTASHGVHWFNNSVQKSFILGDPGIRDSILHGVQACMPHKILIPVSVERVEVGRLLSNTPYRLTATEIEDRGEELVFDLTVSDVSGKVVENWHQVVFRKFGTPKKLRFDAPVLLAPFMERHIKPLIPDIDLIVRMTPSKKQQGENRDHNTAFYRPDGKPALMSDGNYQSNAYSHGWKLCALSNFPVACDLEWITDPWANDWTHLLNTDRYSLVEETSKMIGEDIEISAARIWTVLEALKKIGLPIYTPITLDPASPAHCVTFHASTAHVYSALAMPGGDAVVIASLAVIPIQPKG